MVEPASAHQYEFGEFTLDLDRGVLLRAGAEVKLRRKSFDVLRHLVAHHGRLVSKDELLKAVWSDAFVTDGSLTQCVIDVRKALGGESRRMIRTIPRRGYIFEAPISQANGNGQPPPAQRVRLLLPAVAALLVLAAAVGGTTRFGFKRGQVAEAALHGGRIETLNRSPGGKLHPVLSPDGSRVAFTWDRGNGYELHVQPVGFNTSLQVGPANGASFPAWSPDGRTIAIVRRSFDANGHVGDVVLALPAEGGVERTIWQERGVILGAGLDWSPDGAHFVVPARNSPEQPWRLLLIAASNGQSRWVTAPPVTTVGDSYPTYSPDGRSIAFVHDTGSEISLRVLNVAQATIVGITRGSFHIERPAWTADGRSLIFSKPVRGTGSSLWRVDASGGDPEPVAGTGEGARAPSAARRAGRLVYVQNQLDQNLYRVDLSDPSAAPAPLPGTSRKDADPNLSPDGMRLAFASDRSGQPEIWTMDADGSNATQVTNLGTCIRPRWAPDGRQLAFSARPAATEQDDIFVVSTAGGVPRQLTSDIANETWPSWSADGRWIYYLKFRLGASNIWRVPVGGGPAEQVTTHGGTKARASSDGQFLYSSTRAGVWRQPAAGGKPTMILKFPIELAWGGEWELTDAGIYWLTGHHRSPRLAIEFFQFSTGRSTRAVTPQGVYDVGGGFSVSRDGRWLVFTQRDYEASDLMLIDGLR